MHSILGVILSVRPLGVVRRLYISLYYPKVGQEQLFDLKKDPKEIINLAQNPKYDKLKSNLIKH